MIHNNAPRNISPSFLSRHTAVSQGKRNFRHFQTFPVHFLPCSQRSPDTPLFLLLSQRYDWICFVPGDALLQGAWMCSPEIPKQRNLCCCEVDADIHLASLPVFTVLCSGILDTVESVVFSHYLLSRTSQTFWNILFLSSCWTVSYFTSFQVNIERAWKH